MKPLIIATLSLAVFLGVWTLFFHHAEDQLHQIIDRCEDQVMTAVEAEDWDAAYTDFHKQYKQWHKFRKHALYFLDTQQINDADSSFARTLKYIQAKDLSNSSGELLALCEQLRFFYQNEQISFKNIF